MSEKEVLRQDTEVLQKAEEVLQPDTEAARPGEEALHQDAEKDKAPRKKEKKPRRKKKWVKWVILGSVAAVGVGLYMNRKANPNYDEATAELRDIQTFRNFTGTIEPVEQQNIMPDITGVRIQKLAVKEGDEVKEGDVIAELDPSSIEQQIEELKAAMTASEQASAVSIKIANRNYSNYRSDIDNGLNSQILSASQAIDAAMAQLVSAQQAYNNEVNLNNAKLSQLVLGAMQSVDQAYNGVRTAELQASQANAALDRTRNKSDAAFAGGSKQDAVDSAQNAADTASLSLENAWASYNNAVTSYKAAKINEENSLTGAYDALVTAEISYLNALDSYNAVLNGVKEQLESYALQAEQANVSANSEVNELKLANLEKNLEKCTVKAPMNGVITALNVKEGDLVSATNAMTTVTSFDTMKVAIKINEYDISGVTEGSPVTISVDALDKKSYDGTISRIARTATVANGVSYFESEVEFAADDDVRTGMSVEVRLIIDDVKQAVAIPSSFVQTRTDGSAYVQCYAEGTKAVTEQDVEIGVTDGVYTEIVSGLSEGDVVVDTTPAINYLTDESSVYVESEEAEE